MTGRTDARHGWVVALGGIAGVALLLAAESLGAGTILDVSLRYPGIDKVGHVLQYGLVFLVVWQLTGRVVERRLARVAAAAAVTCVLAVGDESWQRLFAERTFDLADLAADGVGIVLGIGLGPAGRSRRLGRGLMAAAVVGGLGLAAHEHVRLRHYSRGLLHSRHGDLRSALGEYRLALRDGLDSPRFYNELAWAELESGVGDVAAGVRYASLAITASPRDPDILDTYGWALHRSGHPREALPPLQQAVAADPDMYSVHFHLGEVYAALGDRTRAVFHLREQIRRFPWNSEGRRAAASLERLQRVTSS